MRKRVDSRRQVSAGPLGAWAGALWSRMMLNPSAMIIANTGVQTVLRLVSNVILARLLAPSAFALLTITMLILTGMAMVSDVGIAVTALREGQMTREDEHKLWTMQLLRGIGVSLVMLMAAAPIGWLYSDAQLGKVLAAIALMPILQGGQSLYPVLAMGQRRLLPSTMLDIGSKVAGMIGSILIALISPTVWSLVIGTLASTAFATVAGFFIAGYRPRFIVDRRYIANQWRFARWIQIGSTVTFLGSQIDKPLFPFLYGMTTLGVYGIGASIATMPTQITQRWSASVFYPLTAQLLRGDTTARSQLLYVRTTMLLYTTVMTLTVIAVAPVFFTLLYKPQYHLASIFAQILALGVFFDTAESSLRHMPLVEGTPRYELLAVLVKLTGFLLAVGAVIAFKGSAFSYALAVTIGGMAAHLYMLRTCVRLGYLSPTRDLVFVAGLVAATIGLYLLPAPPNRPIILISIGAGIALVAAAATMMIYWRRGLPSLSAEPSPELLRDAADEELGYHPEPI